MIKTSALFLKEKYVTHGAFAKNSFVLFCGTVVGSVLNYVFHLVVGRYVSVEVYGEAESLISLIAIISVPAATLSMVATKYAAEGKAENNTAGSREISRYLNRKVFVYGLPILAGAIILTPFMGRFLRIQNNFSLIIIWLSMFLSFFAAINSGILGGWQKFKEASVTGVWGALIKLVAGIALVRVGFGLNGVIGSFALGILAAYIASVAALKFIFVKKDAVAGISGKTTIQFRSLKKYVMPVFAGNLAITILGNADMILAKRNLDEVSAGQYGALTVVSRIIFFSTGIIASVLFSMSAENNHKGNSSRTILLASLFLVGASSFVATAVYFLYPEWVLGLLFGDKYQDVASYLGWFAVSVALFSLSNVIFQYLLSLHKTRIAYALLAVALFTMGVIFMYGKSIYDILVILIISQAVSLGAGAFFLLERKKRSQNKAAF